MGDMDDPDQLLSMFMSLGTTDHGTLIDQFKKVVRIDDDSLASFFLEANNWNLQGAVWSYFDQQGSGNQMYIPRQRPQAELIGEMTASHGSDAVGSGQQFTKTWRFRNTGTTHWPHSTVFAFLNGERMGAPSRVAVPPAAPGEFADVTVTFTAPREPGQYVGTWRLQHSDHVTECFGEEVWVILNVTDDGGVGLVQAMQSTSMGEGGGQQQQSSSSSFGGGFGVMQQQHGGSFGGQQMQMQMQGQGQGSMMMQGHGEPQQQQQQPQQPSFGRSVGAFGVHDSASPHHHHHHFGGPQ
ncbi:hypothetical protein PTSG_11362 [Salpingoeca rosetta]|uniref:Nbr1 FW domain-containing protein n=1 Tax=Salpingoeca rosetta (strain ATCC 50818 / BSB-021) TaxID=946362 RepID=F2UT65_SALR5|nr:uncharacterized protein PTSG_11362 [Salpingoeca rosetta]EGD81324.1 hypothetical protein PTSG_11362 [Salpingoeca rosetta]|eukprot:XP_004987639.1 hypothetical protein PTSG_11362 [Salpingoeca rosetta]